MAIFGEVQQTASVVPGRACDECSLCCKVLRIDEFQKPAGKWCHENKRRNARIAAMLAAGTSYSDVQQATGCSRATVAKIAKRVKQAA